MPVPVPELDTRSYQQLLDEALARVPVHNPEWTNFNRSDPGVTLIELFAFLTESLLYRANQIPERNRRKFLSLLGLPLQPAVPARGLVAFSNDRGPLRSVTLDAATELRAGEVPFLTDLGVDVLPVRGLAYVKRRLTDPPEEIVAYYEHLYTSHRGQTPPLADLQLYETVPLDAFDSSGVDLLADTVDRCLWVALVARADEEVGEARQALRGRTLSLGIVPDPGDDGVQVVPGSDDAGEAERLRFELPRVPSDGRLPVDPTQRVATYAAVDAAATADLLTEPGVAQITFPADADLRTWTDLDPLEAGTADFPPDLEDTPEGTRVVTWLRLRVAAGARARLRWAGINAAPVSQRTPVTAEVLPDGTGEPDQTASLARPPLVAGTVHLTVTVDGRTQEWEETDDLLTAAPEVPALATDRAAPAAAPTTGSARRSEVFVLDPESGTIRFGDGLRGRRPPDGAAIRASYDHSAGSAGNVGPAAIAAGPTLPAGIKVTNPVPTWGGTDAEQVADGERQIARYLQHRDRLVTEEDYDTLTRRTPGADVARVDVLPAFHPKLSPNEPGDLPGAVTVLVLPRHDADQPDAPRPDRSLLDAVCRYLAPRRLVTTELHVRGPRYVDLRVSVGIDVVPGRSVAEVREAVRRALLRFLSPLPQPSGSDVAFPHAEQGWPLRRPVVALELAAVVSRVPGVRLTSGVLLAGADEPETTQIELRGLDLPRVTGLSVTPGPPIPVEELQGRRPPTVDGQAGQPIVPVPVVAEHC